MRWGQTRAPGLIVALGCALASGCRHSVVWLGDAPRDAGAQASAADGGRAKPDQPDAIQPDLARDAALAGDAGTPRPLTDAATPSAGQTDVDPGAMPQAQTPSAGSAMPTTAPSVSPSASVPGDAGTPPAADGGTGSLAPRVPDSPADCPALRSGRQRYGDIDVQLRVGTAIDGKPGPLLLYWHGTGSSPDELDRLLYDARAEILEAGGVIAAPASTSGRGRATVTDTWYDGDLDAIDQLVGCLVSQKAVDPQRIYAAGCSSGAVQAGLTAILRSEYTAAAMLNSGGAVESYALSEPRHVPAIITAHGAAQSDIVIVNFSQASQRLAKEITLQGGFAVDCDHGGGHCAASAELVRAQWEFLKAHTFSVQESPFAQGLPESFPSYCKIAQK